MTASRPAPRGASAPLLSLRQAATLAGVPRRTLRARVRRGEIPVRVIGKGRSAKLRLTPAALAGAGLLGDDLATISPGAPPPATDLGALLELVREQGARIAALEDQRFQLAGQFGAAVERVRALEERLLALAAPASPSASHQPEAQGWFAPEPSVRRRSASAPARAANGGEAGDPGMDPGEGPGAAREVMVPAAHPPADGRHSRAWRAGALVRRGTIRLVRGPESEPVGPPREA